ncbi:MAG: ATP-binding protein [Actinomycetota bacterium]|nr:ATP-binding protein [Actinomycetota bacterium]
MNAHGGAETTLPTGDLAAYELLPEAVVVIDADQRIAFCNTRAGFLLGVAPDAAGKPLTDVLTLIDDTGTDVARCLRPASAVTDRLAERLLKVRLPGGRLRPVTVAGARLPNGGAVVTFRNAGRQQRLDAARSDLIATVSHEIRSPLTSVKGFTRTMLAKWDRFSDEQKRQMLATIDADADRVTRLLTELLDVARIDAGRVQLHRVRLDAVAAVERVVDKAAHDDDARPITIQSSGRPTVFVDPDKLEQVLTNLVENALRYAPHSPVRVEVIDRGEDVEIAVHDRGPGIPGDQQRQIFAKFSRGRETRRTGTGLGLYITKGLVEAHGGRVWVESEPGDGATFRVALPKRASETAMGAGGDHG